MDMKLLQIFTTVVHTGSISAAARQLSFSQPAVSQYIKSIEREVGTQLFTRDGGHLQITAAGQLLFKHAEDIASNWRFVCRQIQSVGHRTDVKRLLICSFPSSKPILVDAVRTMLKNDPILRIQLIDAEPPGNFDLLRTSQCDVLISFSYGNDPVPRGYRNIPVLSESFVLLIPDTHPMAGADTVALADCQHEQWIGGCARCSKELVETCLGHGFDPEIVCSTDDLEATNYFTAAGVGIALRPALNTLGRPLAGTAVVGVDDPISRHVSVVARTSDASGYPDELAELLKASARKLVADLPERQRRWFTIAPESDTRRDGALSA